MENEFDDSPSPQEPTPGVEILQQSPHCLPLEYKAGMVFCTFEFQHIRSVAFRPLLPFTNTYQYKLARFFHNSKISLKDIDRLFKNGLGLPEAASVHCKSANTCQERMQELINTPQWHKGKMDFHLHQTCVFHYRDITSRIRYLVQQWTFAQHLVYELSRDFNEEGNQVYMEMYSRDWWWRT